MNHIKIPSSIFKRIRDNGRRNVAIDCATRPNPGDTVTLEDAITGDTLQAIISIVHTDPLAARYPFKLVFSAIMVPE